jgi:hypothetical protein
MSLPAPAPAPAPAAPPPVPPPRARDVAALRAAPAAPAPARDVAALRAAPAAPAPAPRAPPILTLDVIISIFVPKEGLVPAELARVARAAAPDVQSVSVMVRRGGGGAAARVRMGSS